MANGLITKIFMVLIYLILIILIPIFLDYLFRLTVRKNRKQKIKVLAEKKSNETGKALIIFNDRFSGIVNSNGSKEPFEGDISEIIEQMADNSCVLIVNEILEYIENPGSIIEQLKIVSGGDLFTINLEKNSPKTFWDYKIKNIMAKPFYLPGDKIEWTEPNGLQKKVQQFYYYVFKILPYNFFAKNPFESSNKKF